jgi:hypothetical protein
MSAISYIWPRASTGQTVLLGIFIESVMLLCFDTFGLKRAKRSLEQLKADEVKGYAARTLGSWRSLTTERHRRCGTDVPLRSDLDL